MFPERERKIFRYHDGRQEVAADPIAIHRKLSFALGGRLNETLDEIHSDDQGQAHFAQEKALAAVRDVFEMAPFDKGTGEGALEEDCWKALDAWLEWAEKNVPPAGS